MAFMLAHKGAAKAAPENTMPAFEESFRSGADGFEADVQMTLDGVPVMSHGYTIDARSDGRGSINDMSFADISKYDFGSWKGSSFAGTGIPSLKECLDGFAGRGIIDLDLKTPIRPGLDIVSAVCGLVESNPCRDNVILSSFDHSLIGRIKDADGSIQTGAIMLPVFSEIEDILEIISGCYPKDIPLDSLSAEDVRPLESDSIIDDFLGVEGMNKKELFMNMGSILGSMFPGKTFGHVGAVIREQSDIPGYVAALGSEPEFVMCHYISCLIDDRIVDRLHRMGKRVVVWTVDRKDYLDRLTAKGVDGIITNCIGQMRRRGPRLSDHHFRGE